jgi:DNA mismatch repair ATPase MutS
MTRQLPSLFEPKTGRFIPVPDDEVTTWPDDLRNAYIRVATSARHAEQCERELSEHVQFIANAQQAALRAEQEFLKVRPRHVDLVRQNSSR